MRVALLVVGMIGCAPELDRPWEDVVVEDMRLGEYAGMADVAIRGTLGPVVVADERCVGPVELDVFADGSVSGAVVCDLPEFGTVELDLVGARLGPQALEGTFSADDELAGRWEAGWVTDEDVAGIVDGASSWDGVRVRYRGTFELTHIRGNGTGT